MTAVPWDIVLEQNGTFNLTVYRQGTNFSGNFVKLTGVSSAGSTIMNWSTSGGQITTAGSSIIIKATTIGVYPSGTSGLSVAAGLNKGLYDMRTFADAGSDNDFRIAGQFTVVERFSK